MDPQQVLRAEDGRLRCKDCHFTYNLPLTEISQATLDALSEFREAALSVPEHLSAHRPAPEMWSPNAYCAHLADVAELVEYRCRRMLLEDRAVLADYDQDAAVRLGDFDQRPRFHSLARTDAGTERYLETMQNIHDSQWSRVGLHESGRELRLSDIAQDLPHELLHHAEDLRRLSP